MTASVSCPSVKTCASTFIVSPRTRLTAKRPQSTSGMTRSMTARMRPSCSPRCEGLAVAALGVLCAGGRGLALVPSSFCAGGAAASAAGCGLTAADAAVSAAGFGDPLRVLLALMLEVDHRERRQCYANGVIAAVRGHRRGVNAAGVADAAPGVARCVRVEHFAPETRLRNAE